MNYRNMLRTGLFFIKKTILLLFIFTLFYACKEESTQRIITPKRDGISDPILNKIDAALTKEPNNAKIYYERANRYVQLEAYDEAIMDYNKSISLDSLSPLTYHRLADTYLDYYQSRKALRTLRDLLDIYPERIPTLLKQTEFQLILKQYDEALISIDKIAKLDPQNGEAAFMLGMVLREQGDLKAATRAFQKATEFDSQITDAWIMLGEIYSANNDPLAKNYFKNAVKIAPDNISALHSYAFYQQNNDQIDEAMELYKKIIVKDKTYLPSYLNMGVLYLEKKNYNEALDHFNMLNSFDSKSYLAYYFKGVCYKELGNITEARNNFQNCLNFNPEYEKAKEALKELNNQ